MTGWERLARRLIVAAYSGALVAAVVLPAGPAGAAPASPGGRGADDLVRTDRGPVRGTVEAAYRTFQGIPYAAPPVGALRWRSPQPAAAWTAPRDATKPAPPCAQNPGGVGAPGSTNEDCLYLNVTTPRVASPRRPLPVMVWVHGGGFVTGTSSIYGAHRLAVRGDVVVVTINYRLGMFGFFGHPGLPGSGSYGLEDQQAALRWVRRNAAAFGGNPRNVTLFGESAGGLSTCAQLTSPAAAGLFHRAAVQSGSCTMTFPSGRGTASSIWSSRVDVQDGGKALAPGLGCPQADPAAAAACLRAIDVTKLLSAEKKARLGPAYGTAVLPVSPARAFQRGWIHRVPVLSGATRDEARLFVALEGQQITADQYRQRLDEAFGRNAARVAAKYPLSAYVSPSVAWATVVTDRVWVCSTLDADRLLAKRVRTFGYEFADRGAPQILPFPSWLPAGAYHASELAYLFDFPGLTFTPDQVRLSDQMIRYWTRFAATGDPNGRDLPRWAPFRNGAKVPHVQALAPGTGGVGPVDLAAVHNCTFWSSLG